MVLDERTAAALQYPPDDPFIIGTVPFENGFERQVKPVEGFARIFPAVALAELPAECVNRQVGARTLMGDNDDRLFLPASPGRDSAACFHEELIADLEVVFFPHP